MLSSQHLVGYEPVFFFPVNLLLLNNSFTGFDDIESARTSRIPLTTVSVPREFLGRAAGRLFWSRIDDPAAPRQRIEIETKLVVRNSTDVVKKGG